MPRASWRGFLRLSLVTCPVYLSPATVRAKPVRLHRVWVPRNPAPEPYETEEEVETASRRNLREAGEPEDDGGDAVPASRIALRPHDPDTGAELDTAEVVKAYEYERGRFVTLTDAELKALDVESSELIDLASFVPRAEVDPVYFNVPYHIHPDGAAAADAYRVIGAAMAQTGMAGIGRLTLSRRERMVLVEPRGAGMLLTTLRAAEEMRPAQFSGLAEGEADPEAVEIAAMIIQRRAGHFDPSTFRDRYQGALRELIEAKMRGLPIKARPAPTPRSFDLMAALKQSLAQESAPAERRRRKPPADRRQRALLLPVSGSGRTRQAGPTPATRRRKA